jgi:AraC-like DNA-binding protein
VRQADPLFQFRLTPTLVRLLALSPAEARALVRRAGLPESAVHGFCTAPLSCVRALLELAAARAGEGVGVQLAEAVPDGTYDTAELLVRTAPSVAEGLAALVRAGALINPVGRFELRAPDGRLELHYDVPGCRDALGPHMNEYTLVYILRALGRVVHGPLAPVAAWLPHRARRERPDVAVALGCPVRFGAATLGFALTTAVAARSLASADAVVFRYLERQAEARLAQLGARTATATVAEAIESAVGLADADLARVARHLATTARTLQRRLGDEGTSFRDVLDQVRQRHAERLMVAGLPSARVADVLGFSDTRALRRALARWTHEGRAR